MDRIIKKVLVFAEEPDDVKVLSDLLRVHFPGAVITLGGERQAQPGNQAVLSKQASTDSDEPEENVLRIFIEARADQRQTKARLLYKGRSYAHTEKIQASGLHEEPMNQNRRLLRLTVYRLIELAGFDNEEIGRTSAWGVLTGVRPTKIVHRMFAQGFRETEAVNLLGRDYGIAPHKARLLTDVALVQTPYLGSSKTISLYIGIPFCPTRCRYCSFPAFSLQRYGHLLNDYINALAREIGSVGALLKQAGVPVQTVYIGGGTPTSLAAEQLDELLTVINNELMFVENPEVTVEGGRPDTLDQEKLTVLKKHRVTRISVNPQTMHDPTLAAIGRKHTSAETLAKYQVVRRVGFPVINMDLIIGLPGENTAILKKSIESILELKPENITLHALAIKRVAVYGQNAPALPAFAEGERMIELAHRTLRQQGYIPYYLYRQKDILAHSENVGYTLPGHPCIYNIQMIEEQQTIIGCGVGAGSKYICSSGQGLENIYNPKDIGVYLDRIEEIIAAKVDKLKAFV